MNLPDYFFADLPAGASITPSMIGEACQTLKRNREQYLRHRSTDDIIRALSSLAESWMDPEYPFRLKLLADGPEATGFSKEILRIGIDEFFSAINAKNLRHLIVQDLGHAKRLDGFHANDLEQNTDRASTVRGPELLVHIAAGNIPNSTLTSMLLGLLLRSAQFVKCGTGGSFIPRLFAHSLYEVEPKLAACLEIAEWKGGAHSLESVLFSEADCVTANGSNETLEKIRSHLPAKVRFLGYGHRVSFGYVTHEALSGFDARKIVTHAAHDVIAWNQLGCLSPHVFYVENGGKMTPEEFAGLLATELAHHEQHTPRGKLQTEEAAAIHHRRSFYDIRSANSQDVKKWQSEQSTAWTVVYESDPRFQLSCLNRFIYIKAVANPTEALQGADNVFGQVSTVGIAAPLNRAQLLAEQLSRWGVPRICPIGKMQQPPLTWRHDGRPSLADLVTWSDWEM
ncbi:MAG: Acyl-CoA reductase [Verrucomicrobiales bacterium]|nr:Acyl-CoA reductase [Verrucomicrobiales bacterium]